MSSNPSYLSFSHSAELFGTGSFKEEMTAEKVLHKSQICQAILPLLEVIRDR